MLTSGSGAAGNLVPRAPLEARVRKIRKQLIIVPLCGLFVFYLYIDVYNIFVLVPFFDSQNKSQLQAVSLNTKKHSSLCNIC